MFARSIYLYSILTIQMVGIQYLALTNNLCFLHKVHIQTIGILVAEKTELQSALNQNQRSSEQLIGIEFGAI